MEKNKRKIYININNTPLDVLEFAKEQLVKYLSLILSCDFVEEEFANFSINLKVDKNLDGIKYDGFRVSVGDDYINISAIEPRGVLYGVYDVLEKYFGLKFLSPDCEIIPTKVKICLPTETYISNPAFPLRTAWYAATDKDGEFYSKMRNHTMVKVNDPKYGGYCGWERVKEWGWGHNTLAYVSKELYAKDHPELFAYNRNSITDICFSNGVTDDGEKSSDEISCVNIIVDYIKKRIDEDQTLRYFNIGQSDSWVGFENECNCERCKAFRKKYGSSGVLIRFVNIIADEIKKYVDKKYPSREVYITAFSYSQTFRPPVKKIDGAYLPIDETVVPRENVIIMLAQTDAEMTMIYPFFDEKYNPLGSEVYKGWLSITKKMQLWVYGVNFHDFLWYLPTMDCIDEAIKEVAKQNCEAVVIQLSYSDVNDWQSLCKGYVASKLMWDPSLDKNLLLQEFLDGYYGVASTQIKKLMDLFDDHFRKISSTPSEFIVHMSKSDDVLMNANYYPKSLFDNAERILDEAENLVKNSGEDVDVLLKRLGAVRLTPMRMKLYNYFVYEKDKKSIFAYYERFRKIADEVGISKYAESKARTMEELDYEMEQLRRLMDNPLVAWDIYRYLYDGVVENYQLPKRNQ